MGWAYPEPELWDGRARFMGKVAYRWRFGSAAMERFFEERPRSSSFQWRARDTYLAIAVGDRRVNAAPAAGGAGQCSFLLHGVSVAEGQTSDVDAFSAALESWLYGRASSGDLARGHGFLTQTPAAHPLERGRYTEWLWQQDAVFGPWLPLVVVARTRARITRFHPYFAYPHSMYFGRWLGPACDTTVEPDNYEGDEYRIYRGPADTLDLPTHGRHGPRTCCDLLEPILEAWDRRVSR